MRAIHLVTATALCLVGAGCNHMTTRVPGVLDLRSDGSDVPVDNSPPKAESRSGFDSLLWGDGAQGAGQTTVVDRKYWIIGLIGIGNESATEEINAAVGNGAFRNVTIGEEYTFGDMAVGFCGSFIPLAGCVVHMQQGGSPMDFKMSGTHVKIIADGGGALPPSGEEPTPPAPVPGEE